MLYFIRLKPHFEITSGTLKIGTNGSITVSGSNYGTLRCSSTKTTIATCSVSGTTVTIVPMLSVPLEAFIISILFLILTQKIFKVAKEVVKTKF